MSGETEKAVSGWTVDTLHSHVVKMFADLTRHIDQRFDAVSDAMAAADKRYEQRFDAQEKAVKDALAAADRAVSKAETAAEKRFDSVNEFRGQLKDQALTLLPRPEAEQRFLAFEQRLVRVESFQAQAVGETRRSGEGKQTALWLIGLVVAAVLAAAAILARR